MDNEDTSTQLKASLARLEATRAKQLATTTAAGPQLPLWSDKLRGLPNSLARGALFTCRGKAIERLQLSRVEIASAAGVRIAYTGLELRQDDQDVWLQIAHLARSHRLGIHVDITAYQLLKALGWGTGSKDYTRLRECFLRLTEGTVWVAFDAGREGFSGRLVDKIQWADAGSGQRERWRIKLDPSILHLFGGEDFALLDWQQRLGLRALAKWLHSFYSTHREPHPIGVSRLYQLSGSANKRLSGFRRELVGALDELQRSAFLHTWWIDPKSDLVSVRRNLARQLNAPESTIVDQGA